MAGWQRSVQHPGPAAGADPVVAEPFRFAPVLAAGDAWPLFGRGDAGEELSVAA